MNTTMPFAKLHLKNAAFKNPRTKSGLSDESIRELAINIGLHGLLNALIVMPDGLIIAGQRRYRAIEFLFLWFSSEPSSLRELVREELKSKRFDELFGDLTHADVSLIEATVKTFQLAGIPVNNIMAVRANASGLSLADNLQREDLSSYEIAQYLYHLHTEEKLTQADLARLVGKSKTYVSRKIACWRSSSDQLRQAWEAGELTDDQVIELSQMSEPEQVRALSGPIPRGRRGPANRPGIDTIKEVLGDLTKRVDDVTTTQQQYARGVLDALRWVNGDKTTEAFASVMEVAHAGVPS